MKIPKIGIEKKIIIKELQEAKSNDVNWKNGRSWSLVYYAGEEHTDFLKQVYNLYFSENAAGPSLFPSLQLMEAEVVSMVANLLGGDEDTVGTMTSGGTESILLAMKAYRDWARESKPHILIPEILVPASAHPAFLKAGHYFDIKMIQVPLDTNFQVNISILKELITENTICMVASAPTFSQGVMDPVSDMGEIAKSYSIGLHVDACLGGFMLPFIRKLGYKIPDFDFNVAGVTSISADLHKNAYTAKGASAVLYRKASLRRHQFTICTDWQGGIYASPTMMGTRPGGAVAAAWAALKALGENGYMDIAQRTMDTTQSLMNGITSLQGLHILGNPVMSVFAFSSETVDVFSLGDRLEEKNWYVNRQNNPSSLHMIATQNHFSVIDEFLSDLNKAFKSEQKYHLKKNIKRSAVLYGGIENINSSTDPREIAIQRLEKLYSL